MRVRLSAWIERGTWSAAALTVLVLVAGSATSFGVGSVLRDSARRAADRAMDGRTALVTTAVTTEIGRYLDQMRTLTAALGAAEDLTTAQFRQLTLPLAGLGLSGAVSVAFVVQARDGDVAGVQAAWRRRGSAGLSLRPVGAGPHLFAVVSTRLDGEQSSASGRDLAQAKAPRTALAEALRSNTIAVSDTYQFFADRTLPAARRQHSFVLAAPVYRTAVTGRPQAFQGWVMMALRGQDFIKATLSRVAQNLVDVTLAAGNADGSRTTVATLTAAATGGRDLHRRVEIPVAQRRWELRTAAAHAALPGGGQTLAGAMTGTLLVLSALLAALVATLASGKGRAQRLVDEATGELRRAEREAREQAQLLSTILDSITDGVTVVDQDGLALLHNPAGKAILGVEADAVGPNDWQRHYGVYRPEDSQPYPYQETPLFRALCGESPTGVEVLIRNPNHLEGVLIVVNARPLELGDGSRGAVAIYRDVTAERAHEAELAGFAGVVAHDLKTPLATVVGYTELVSDVVSAELPSAASEQALAHLARIEATTARMRMLIDDLLAYTTARDAALHPTAFALGDLVHEVVLAQTDAARVNRGVSEFPDLYVGPLPAVYADRVLVRQVLENLIGNALKYTPPGQPARVDITGHLQPEGRTGSAMVRVEIADRGIGLPAGEHSRVFARFHRAHPGGGYPGTGLGLAICHRIVERHGGTIGVTDNPGGGTCFRFTIPARPPDDVEPLGDVDSGPVEHPAGPLRAVPQAAVAPGAASSGRSSSA